MGQLSDSERRQFRRDLVWVGAYLLVVTASGIIVSVLRAGLSDAVLRVLANTLVVTGLGILGKCVWALHEAEYVGSGNILAFGLFIEVLLYFLVATQVPVSNRDLQAIVVTVVFGTTLAGIILLLIAREPSS